MKIGPYELLEVVGKGGMGVVYRGLQAETNQPVAVKIMAEETAFNPVLLRRFEQECAAACRLRHPHIVRGLDYGVESDRPYLVMEFIDGRTLAQHVRRHGPLPEAEAIRVILQVADALQLAHGHKLIHRDVKPDNILLTADGQAKLADLGLLKDLDAGADLTRPRTGLGTFVFTAPEQYGDARSADARCDIYGLGATLYFALTGAVPFQGRGSLTVLQKKTENDYVRPRKIVPSLSERVERVICQALDAAPGRRPGSCAEFADLLLRSAPTGEGAEAGAAVPDANERRVALRYPSALGASCRPLQDGAQQWYADIMDVSRTGLALQLDQPFEPGATLNVEISDEQTGTAHAFVVRVCWVREGASGRWNLGCAFGTELSAGELNSLLESQLPTVVVQSSARLQAIAQEGC